MKKIVILAISAIFVANISAQEFKKDCFEGKKLSKEEKIELDLKRLTNELMLNDQQAEKFAVTYREYAAKLDELFKKNLPAKFEQDKVLTDAELDKLAKQRFEGFKALADLQAKYYDKFRKDLSARQVEKLLSFDEPFGPKPCCDKPEGPKGEGKAKGPKFDGHKLNGQKLNGQKFDVQKFNGPHPERSMKQGPLPEAPKPAPQK